VAVIADGFAGLPERFQPTNLPHCHHCEGLVGPGGTHVCPAPTIGVAGGTYVLTPWHTWEWRPW
jgi:hypothetical protein